MSNEIATALRRTGGSEMLGIEPKISTVALRRTGGSESLSAHINQ